MKKLISILLSIAVIAAVFALVPLSASAETSGDYEYTVNDDGTATITEYNGSATNLTIPSTLGGYKVVEIDSWAFMGCKELQSVTFPNSLKEIGAWSFQNCESLTSVTIPKSVEEIGDWAFKHCKNLKSVAISNGVKSIGFESFHDCTSLKSVKIPKSVKKIGYCAFGHFDTTYYAVEYDRRIDGFKIKGYYDTEAERYAKDEGLKFVPLNRIVSQKITVKSSYTKAYNSNAFNLNAKAKTKLSYKSSNTKIASVSKNGKVTVKRIGTATITVKAKAQRQYKAASKKIKIKVTPAKVKLGALSFVYEGGERKAKKPFVQQKGCSYQVKVSYKTSEGVQNFSTTYPKSKNALKFSVYRGYKYTAKIRAFKKVDGKTYYGAWSSTVIKA